jgi:hypothetical protein
LKYLEDPSPYFLAGQVTGIGTDASTIDIYLMSIHSGQYRAAV